MLKDWTSYIISLFDHVVGCFSTSNLGNHSRKLNQTNGIRYSVSRRKIYFINVQSRNLLSFKPKLYHNFGSKLCRFRKWKLINYILHWETEYLIPLVCPPHTNNLYFFQANTRQSMFTQFHNIVGNLLLILVLYSGKEGIKF